MNPREYLFSLERLGVKLGLDNIRRLLDAAGMPQDAYPVIHVGGTNGKGSVVAAAAAVARAAGYRVGRFTSPHLSRVNERFLLDSTPISDAALDEEVEFFRGIAGSMPHPPTFFEMTTAVAFRWFQRMQVDVAVVEVGLGGRLDSTNVVTPAVAAITNIAMDHMQFLGDSIEQIAAEKAGIVKPNVPVVLGALVAPARDVILRDARDRNAPVQMLGRDFNFSLHGDSFSQSIGYRGHDWRIGPTPLGLNGRCQGENAAVALAVLERMRYEPAGSPHLSRLDEKAVAAGLRDTRWPCRLEKVLDHPPVYVDVAHNPAGARQLAAEFPRAVTLLGVSSDKDAAQIIRVLAPVTALFVFTQYSGPRAMPAAALAEMADVDGIVAPQLEEAIVAGVAHASEQLPLLVTGSIFLAGEARGVLVRNYGAQELQF